MAVWDVFSQDAFSLRTLTTSINLVPNKYDRIIRLNLFTPEPIRTVEFSVEEYAGVLNLVQSQPRNGPPNLNISGKRKVRPFTTFHFPLNDVVTPSDVQDIRRFNTENQLEDAASVVNRKLVEMRDKHAATREFLEAGALKGIVIDADGTTLVNLFTEFGITQKSINFALGTATTNVVGKALEAKRHIETNAKGESIRGFHALASPEFFDALTSHALVKAAYANWEASASRLAGDMRDGFMHGGIMWEEYNGSFTEADGTVRPLIPANEAIIFPLGTSNTFRTVMAPANRMGAANMLGEEVYALAYPIDGDKGFQIDTESNLLPICKRPALLVRATIS